MQVFALLMLFGAVFSYWWFVICNNKLKMGKIAMAIVPLILLLWGFVSTKFFLPLIEAKGNISNMPGMRFFGSLFFDWIAVLVIAGLLRIERRALFDVWTISMVAYLAIGRVNCFVTGCCYGAPIFGTRWRWPIREIEIIANIAFLCFFILRVLKNKTDGEVYPIYLVYYGVIRFILECFRVEGVIIGGNGFHLAHVWSIISVLAGVLWLLFLSEKKKAGKKTRR